MKIRIFFALMMIFAMLPLSAFACACCADAGTYFTWTSKPEQFQIDLLGQMKFDKQADLYITEADFEIIRGLNSIKTEASTFVPSGNASFFSLDGGFTKRKWRLNFTTPSGKKGSLTLPMPTKMNKFVVDIHDNDEENPTIILYKEFRFNGIVESGTGFFAGAMTRPARYQLVLQGRGNGCDNAEDFTHWILDVKGTRADFRLLGEFATDPQN